MKGLTVTHGFQFRLEMCVGQKQRTVDADAWALDGQWLVFYRKPSTGGQVEYWRVRTDLVASVETVRP